MLKRIFTFTGVLFSFGLFTFAQDLVSLTDKFYDGLSAIIERNMDNPINCLREVDSYYQDNQALIQKIRSETAKAMQKIEPMLQQYMKAVDGAMAASDFDEDGLQELEREMSSYKSQQVPPSAAAERYAKAMEYFSMKHPQYAMTVALKAMELMPDVQIPKY